MTIDMTAVRLYGIFEDELTKWTQIFVVDGDLGSRRYSEPRHRFVITHTNLVQECVVYLKKSDDKTSTF